MAVAHTEAPSVVWQDLVQLAQQLAVVSHVLPPVHHYTFEIMQLPAATLARVRGRATGCESPGNTVQQCMNDLHVCNNEKQSVHAGQQGKALD